MNPVKAIFFILFGLFFCPFVAHAQVEFSVKARATGFYGKYGDEFIGIGYEPSVTFQPNDFWAGGVSFSENLLGGYSDIHGKMSQFNFHVGAKRSLTPYFHPFIYTFAGFRFTEYKTSAYTWQEEPLLSSIALNYGVKSGLQIGKGKWRFEGSLELMSGTKSRYLTEESIEKANSAGTDYRSTAERSYITGLSAGIGITYVLDWDNVELE